MPSDPHDQEIRIGLVLGAGGVPGGAYLRAAMAEIETLTGWAPAGAATIVGTSVGALNAARLAPPGAARPVDRAQLDALTRLGRILVPPRPSRFAALVVRGRRLGGALLARIAPAGRHAADYEVADGPYHPGVRVVSVVRGFGRPGGTRRVVRLVDASSPAAELYASAAVPGFARPIEIGGEELIDGAVYSTTNADLIDVATHDALVVIAPMAPREGGSFVARSHRALLVEELRPWRASAKPVIVVSPTGHEQLLRSDRERFADAARARVREATPFF